MPSSPVAVVCVRDATLPAGGAETAAEVAGRTIVIGGGAASAAAMMAGIVGRVELAEQPGFAPAAWARTLAPLLRGAPFVALPASPDGRDLAVRLAAELGWPLLAGALQITADEVVVARQGGLVQQRVRPVGPFVATLQPGVRGIEIDPGQGLETTSLDLAVEPSGDATVLGILPLDAATIDLAEASRLVGGGAGLMSSDDPAGRFDQLTRVGLALGASMGATRVVTDAGWVGHDRQIGTTGVMVDPKLYLAFGISGAVQHTAGLGHPEHVVSVNTDAYCPMMAMADLAVVGDANSILDELASRLGVAGEAQP